MSSRTSDSDIDDVPRRDVCKIVEYFQHDLIEKLDCQVMDLAKRTIVDALETCNVDHNKTLIKGALRSALDNLLPFILEDESKESGSHLRLQ